MKIRTRNHYEIPSEWRIAFRQMYRALRIRVGDYPAVMDANPGSRREGNYYGMSREEAKDHLASFMGDLDWLCYLGSK